MLVAVEMHSDQLPISVGTVRALVDEQFPQWQHLPITEIRPGGTVTAVFRIGERMSARLPLRPATVDSMRQSLGADAAAACELFGRTRFLTPEPIAIGEPGAGYPLPWSVQSWLPGTPATDEHPGHSVAFARDLAEFIRQVRTIDTRGRTFDGDGRGGDLRCHDAWMETCFQRSERLLDIPRLRRMWAELRELPRDAEDVMSHSDLIPANALVRHDRLVGVLDVGGLGPADPALDLVCAWHLLEPGPRQVLRDELGSDDLEWNRGQAWAFEQAMGVVWYYVDSNPAMAKMGRRTLQRIAEG